MVFDILKIWAKMTRLLHIYSVLGAMLTNLYIFL